MEDNYPSTTYSTQNTELASYLLLKGIELVEIVSPDRISPSTLVFSNHDGIVRELETEFYAMDGDAKVARAFYAAYRSILRRIKEGKANAPGRRII